TYTTLAKATKVGARYLSTSRDATSSDATKVAAAKLAAQSLVVCGYTNCDGQTPVVAGLTTANVDIPPIIVQSQTVKYWKVKIKNYNYQSAVFNLATRTGSSSSTFYYALTPGTTMRYMP